MAGRHDILEGVETLPGRLLGRDTLTGQVLRGITGLQVGNVARAIRENVLGDGLGRRVGRRADRASSDPFARPHANPIADRNLLDADFFFNAIANDPRRVGLQRQQPAHRLRTACLDNEREPF